MRSEGPSIIHLCGAAAVVVWWCFSCSSHSLSEKTRPTVLQQLPPVLRWAVIRGEEEGSSTQREPFCYSNLRKIWISCFHSLRMRPLSSGHIVNLTEACPQREKWVSTEVPLHTCNLVSCEFRFCFLFVLQPICSLLLPLSLNLNHVQRFGRNTSLSASGKSTSGITYWFHFTLTDCGCFSKTSDSTRRACPEFCSIHTRQTKAR